jgi:negative regulator of sigma-B (phosphoserine phosphatase)
METLISAPIEWAVAELAQPGQSESGDRHLVLPTPDGGLVAVVDGLGHGAEAASAAKVAVRALERGGDRPLVQLFRDCHQSLIGTRGAVISAASFSVLGETMTWLGVGNVEGRLLRAPVSDGLLPDALLVRGGVVGAHLPRLVARTARIRRGDMLIVATDGIRSEFLDAPLPYQEPQALADHVLARWGTQADDALVLVVRYLGAV